MVTKTIPKEKKGKRQNDYLRRPYKYLRKEEKQKEKRKDIANCMQTSRE